MNLLFFSYAYPTPVNPGLGTFNRTWLASLAQSHQVRVVCPVPWPDVWRGWRGGRWTSNARENFQAIPGVQADYVPYYYPPKIARAHYDRFLWWSVRATLRQAVREFRPDAVVSYWAHPDGAVAVRAAQEAGVPSILTVGGSDVLLLARHGARREAILRTLHSASAIVTVGRHIANVLRTDGLPTEKLHTIYRGVDRATFSPGDPSTSRQRLGIEHQRPLIIAAGRLVPVKDWPTLIRACGLLRDRGIDFECCLIGNGELRERLQTQIDDSSLHGHVRLVGSQTQSQLAEWYRAASVTALTSVSEGVPNVLLESMCCGTPFVASNVGGIPEIADPIHDRLCPVGDAAAFAEALDQQLRRDPQDSRPPRWFEPPSTTVAADRLIDIIDQCAGIRTIHHTPVLVKA